jgi:hypothetical protein
MTINGTSVEVYLLHVGEWNKPGAVTIDILFETQPP